MPKSPEFPKYFQLFSILGVKKRHNLNKSSKTSFPLIFLLCLTSSLGAKLFVLYKCSKFAFAEVRGHRYSTYQLSMDAE